MGSDPIFSLQLAHVSQAHPNTKVAKVSGKPTRKYSWKLIVTSGRARSTTMMFATEPVIVRFPANVLAMARMSQAV